jgi:hypothetical protein
MFANGARNATFSDNDIDLIDVPEYLYTSPYNNIFEIDQTNRAVFWSPYLAEFQHLIGDNIKFDDVVYSVSAVEWDSTKTGYPKDNASHPDGMWKVTLTSALPEELDDTVSLAMTQNFGNTIGYQSAGNIHGVTVSNNKIKNGYYALYCASNLIAGESGVRRQ